ncbi:MAG TPA: DUF1746 domain-containing protein [Gammaproteobacteria bacterium]|nr:DUF1746 domain-containing protein [Gammaproteobacteria bacterium]
MCRSNNLRNRRVLLVIGRYYFDTSIIRCCIKYPGQFNIYTPAQSRKVPERISKLFFYCIFIGGICLFLTTIFF